MKTWPELNDILVTASNQHKSLATKFADFANYVHTQISESSSHIKGLKSELDLEHDLMFISFTGRTITFEFKSYLNENNVLIGEVKCFSKIQYPKQTQVETGKFTFSTSGKTNLIANGDNDPIHIGYANDWHNIYTAWQYIYESLIYHENT